MEVEEYQQKLETGIFFNISFGYKRFEQGREEDAKICCIIAREGYKVLKGRNNDAEIISNLNILEEKLNLPLTERRAN